MILPSVDFPAPFSPTRAWIEPGAIETETSLSAWTPPKRLLRSLVSINAVSTYAVSICAGLSAVPPT